MSRLDEALQQKEKSVSSLQFEKAALAANVERLKSSESSTCSYDNMSSVHSRDYIELQEAQTLLRDERENTATKDSRIQELEVELQALSARAEQQQQTISLLVSEKTTLTASVERLQDAETSASQIAHYFTQSLYENYYRVTRNDLTV